MFHAIPYVLHALFACVRERTTCTARTDTQRPLYINVVLSPATEFHGLRWMKRRRNLVCILRLQMMRTFFRLIISLKKQRKRRQIRMKQISYQRCRACSPPSFLLIIANECMPFFVLRRLSICERWQRL
jgi:hypothetical protein